MRLRDIRKEKGVKQQTLCADLGVTQSTISGWENGKIAMSAKDAQRVADYFGMSVDYLLGRTDESAHTHAHVKGLYPLDAYVKIPALGIIRGGQPICTEQGEYDEVYADAKFGDGNHFMLKVQGDSMSPTIPNGAWAIIEHTVHIREVVGSSPTVSTKNGQKMQKSYCLVGFLYFNDRCLLRRIAPNCVELRGIAWILLSNYYQK